MKKRVWVGTVGPYLYDTLKPMSDPEFAGLTYHALSTNGQIMVAGPPVYPLNVIRLEDLEASDMRNYFFSLGGV